MDILIHCYGYGSYLIALNLLDLFHYTVYVCTYVCDYLEFCLNPYPLKRFDLTTESENNKFMLESNYFEIYAWPKHKCKIEWVWSSRAALE